MYKKWSFGQKHNILLMRSRIINPNIILMMMTYWLNEGTVHTDKFIKVYTLRTTGRNLITLKVKYAPTAFFLMNIYICIWALHYANNSSLETHP